MHRNNNSNNSNTINPNNLSLLTLLKETYLNKLGYFLIIGWTLLLLSVLAWNCWQVQEGIQQEAIVAVRMSLENDLAFRSWATEHGGVYVPATRKTPPNPYLSHINNHTFTSYNEEQVFTLLNPAYIMRQVYELRLDKTGVYNRLTSLDAINPVNLADAWERQALLNLAADHNLQEIVAITDLNGESAIRYMKPFLIEPSCLKCHANQGYQIGDLRGGLSASIPLAPYAALINARQLALLPGYMLIWLVGLGGIGWFMYRLNTSAIHLQRKEIRNRAMVEAIPDVLFRYSAQGVILDAEIKDGFSVFQAIKEMYNHTNFIGKNIAEVFPPIIAQNIAIAIEKVITTGKAQLIEHSLILDSEQFYFEERLVLEGENEVVAIIRDVTQQKNSEAKLEYLSYHDSLTSIYNRNYLNYQLNRLKHSGQHPLTIISADVNGLKIINDALGHIAGDNLLINCAQVLKDSLRSSDILARIGGDEFVAILLNTNEAMGQEVIYRIRTNITKYNAKHPNLPLSLSLGIATTADNDNDLIKTYKLADDLMYKEKRENGTRNKGQIIKSLISASENQDDINLDLERLNEICFPADI